MSRLNGLIIKIATTLDRESRDLLQYQHNFFKKTTSFDGWTVARSVLLLFPWEYIQCTKYGSNYSISPPYFFPDEVALGSTQPLKEMSTGNLSGGKKRPARRADNLAAKYEQNVWKCGSLNLSQSSTAWTEITLLFYLPTLESLTLTPFPHAGLIINCFIFVKLTYLLTELSPSWGAASCAATGNRTFISLSSCL
jgi:hypothetical protein